MNFYYLRSVSTLVSKFKALREKSRHAAPKMDTEKRIWGESPCTPTSISRQHIDATPQIFIAKFSLTAMHNLFNSSHLLPIY
jgi:hypothetical protein